MATIRLHKIESGGEIGCARYLHAEKAETGDRKMTREERDERRENKKETRERETERQEIRVDMRLFEKIG